MSTLKNDLLDDRVEKNLRIANVPFEENTDKSLKITMKSKYGYSLQEVDEALSRLEAEGVIENDSGIWRVVDEPR